MALINSIEALSKLIPIAQILIVALTLFTIWATFQKGKLEKQDKAKLIQEIQQTKDITGGLAGKNEYLEVALKESNSKLNDLYKKTAPRSLSPYQKTEIINKLSSLPASPVIVACVMSNNECCKYADEFNNLFKELKWQPDIVNQAYLDDAKEDVAIAATSNDLIQKSDIIIKTLNDVGIKTNSETIRPGSLPGRLQANAIYLIVGTKKVKD